MALHVPRTGYQAMMKDGAKNYQGMDEVVYRNIEACKEFGRITKTSFGPHGMNKIILNTHDKRFVTNDAMTMVNELDIKHPAAKMIVMAAKMQEQEVGDGANLVIQMTTELLKNAEKLLRIGLTPNEVIDGYKAARDKAFELIEDLTIHQVTDVSDYDQVRAVIKSVIMSKQFSYADVLSELVTRACLFALPQKSSAKFNLDNVRTVKIIGGGVASSRVIRGLLFPQKVEGTVTIVENAKIVLYTCPFKLMATETKGTVLLNTADQLLNYSKDEESFLERFLDQLRATGVNVVVTSDQVSEAALDYCNRNEMMVVRIMSKYDMARISRATTAFLIPTLRVPTQEEIGHSDQVEMEEIGGTECLIFRQEREDSAFGTVILRGSSTSILDEMERVVDDGVNAFKMITTHNGYVAGAGAAEMALSLKVSDFAKTRTDLSQYSIKAFGTSLQVIPTILAENFGMNSNELLAKLIATHTEKGSIYGVKVDSDTPEVIDAKEYSIYDNSFVKKRALAHATYVTCTILSIDQIIMAKTAGGPKMRPAGPMDQD